MAVCDSNFGYLSSEWRKALGVLNLATGLMAFIGNLVAFLIIFKTKHFRNLSVYFLGSLIMTDFLVGLLLEPMHVAQLFSEELRNNCTFNGVRRYLSTLLIGASISSIALISYDRYMHLSTTQNYNQHMNKRKAAVMITVGWVIPAVVPILIRLGKDEQIYSSIIFAYVSIYFTIIVGCYIFIIKILRKKESEMFKSQTQNKKERRQGKNDVRAARVVATIIVCFAILIIPISIYHCIVAVKTFLPNSIPSFKETSKEICYAVGMTLAMTNSALNPLIYFLRNPKFKEILLKELKGLYPASCTSKRFSSENTGSGTECNSV